MALAKATDSPPKVAESYESIGEGSFGKVYKVRLFSGDLAAVKKTELSDDSVNRELEFLRKFHHCNTVKLLNFSYTYCENQCVWLEILLEYMPQTLADFVIQQNRPLFEIKLYMYQVFRSLAYIHALGVCHRDIKPHNLLINPHTGVLKLCDFTNAKRLIAGGPHCWMICTMGYQAPELLFFSTNYTTKIDMWSAGCVLAELLLGRAVFTGRGAMHLLLEIMKVMGTPTSAQVRIMNSELKDFTFPSMRSLSWQQVLHQCSSDDAINLVSRLLEYTPGARISPLQACTHKFFDELRVPNTRLPNNRDLPLLFNFTELELKIQPQLNSKLVPSYERGSEGLRRKRSRKKKGIKDSSS